MGLSNSEKQRRHRERLKERGLVHVQGWVSPTQAVAIRAILRGEPVTYDPALEEAPDALAIADDQAEEALPRVRYRRRKLPRRNRPGEQEVVIDGEAVATAWRNANGQWLAATIAFAAHPLRPYKTRRAAVQALINMEVIPKAQP